MRATPASHLRPAAEPSADLAAQVAGIERSLTVEAAAHVLGCDGSTIRRMLREGLLRGHRVGARNGGVRVFASSIDDYRRESVIGAERKAARAGGKGTRCGAPSARQNEALAMLADLGCIILPGPGN